MVYKVNPAEMLISYETLLLFCSMLCAYFCMIYVMLVVHVCYCEYSDLIILIRKVFSDNIIYLYSYLFSTQSHHKTFGSPAQIA